MGAKRILVIDDELTVLQFAERSLRHFGYAVTLARNGEEGLAALSATPDAFRLAIVDRGLPDLPPEALLERLRAVSPGLPALVISGAPWEGALPNARFLAKPFGLQEFIAAVQEQVDPS